MKQSLTPPEYLLSYPQSRCQITALKRKQTCVFYSFLHLNSYSLHHSLSLSLTAAAVFLFVRHCVWVIFAPFSLSWIAHLFTQVSISLFLSLCVFFLFLMCWLQMFGIFHARLTPEHHLNFSPKYLPCFVEFSIKNLLWSAWNSWITIGITPKNGKSF